MAIGTKSSATAAQQGNSLGRVVEWRWGLLSLWLAGTSLFLARAIACRFPRPLSSLGLIAVGVVAIILAIGLRILLRGRWQASATAPKSRLDWLAQLLPTLGLVLLVTGFTVAGSYPTGLVLLWVLAAGEAAFGAGGPWTLPLVRRWFVRGQAAAGTVIVDQPRSLNRKEALALSETLAEPVARGVVAESAEPATADELPWLWQESTALQELRYMTLPEQGLCVAGSQRFLLPAAQTVAVVHTVLHPPFDAVPTVTLEMQEPDTVAIKAAQILPHGIRWELRAEQPADHPREVQWAFSASSTTTRDPRG